MTFTNHVHSFSDRIGKSSATNLVHNSQETVKNLKKISQFQPTADILPFLTWTREPGARGVLTPLQNTV